MNSAAIPSPLPTQHMRGEHEETEVHLKPPPQLNRVGRPAHNPPPEPGPGYKCKDRIPLNLFMTS